MLIINKTIRTMHVWLAVCTTAMAVCAMTVADVSAQGETRFELAPSGNEARYRVREQFAGVSLPNDAVGTTSAITGGLVLSATGVVVSDQSRFVVDLRTLASDSESRDRAIQTRVLETATFPHIELTIQELRGLPFPLPASGDLTFELIGELALHGQKQPSTWHVTAKAADGGISGRATTSFAFGDFGMPVPTSFRVLSVEDRVRLEYDFHLRPVR